MSALEKTITELKGKHLPLLEPDLGARVASLEFSVFMDLLARWLFAKQWPCDLDPKVPLPVGKLSEEKVKVLGIHWAKVVDRKYPTLGFTAASGLLDESQEDPDQDQAVDLQSLRSLKRNLSSCPDPDALRFKRATRSRWSGGCRGAIPQPGKPEFRKDITQGGPRGSSRAGQILRCAWCS